jgi:hypothetical protein
VPLGRPTAAIKSPTWKGNVSEMPFQASELDVVLCQHGLQYFPERFVSLDASRAVRRRPFGRQCMATDLI